MHKRYHISTRLLLAAISLIALEASLGAEQTTADPSVTIKRDGAWKVVETANFRCRCQLPDADAIRLGQCCEAWRERLQSTWYIEPPTTKWAPKCEVCVHTDRLAYNKALNRPGDTSVGSTMMNFDHGRTVLRRIDVRSDASDWSNAALPHELTHVVLGERFGGHALPRWADEGIAMLSESQEKHRERLASLRDLIRGGKILGMADLTAMNRLPAAGQRDAFYGQSVALASWLIAKSTPAEFADFIDLSRQQGMNVALRRHYKLDGLIGLQREWDRWIRTPERIEFVSLQVQEGVAPIIASIEPKNP